VPGGSARRGSTAALTPILGAGVDGCCGARPRRSLSAGADCGRMPATCGAGWRPAGRRNHQLQRRDRQPRHGLAHPHHVAPGARRAARGAAGGTEADGWLGTGAPRLTASAIANAAGAAARRLEAIRRSSQLPICGGMSSPGKWLDVHERRRVASPTERQLARCEQTERTGRSRSLGAISSSAETLGAPGFGRETAWLIHRGSCRGTVARSREVQGADQGLSPIADRRRSSTLPSVLATHMRVALVTPPATRKAGTHEYIHQSEVWQEGNLDRGRGDRRGRCHFGVACGCAGAP